MSRPGAAVSSPQAVYPLPNLRDEGVLDKALAALRGPWVAASPRSGRGAMASLDRAVRGRIDEYLASTDQQRLSARHAARARLRSKGPCRHTAVQALGIVAAEAGECWGSSPEPPVRLAALSMLCGRVAECASDSDDRQAIALAAVSTAMAGLPVHLHCACEARLRAVVSVVEPLGARMDLETGVLREGMGIEDRRSAYRAGITCGLTKDFTHDALRDARLLLDRPGDIRLRLERLHEADPRSDRFMQRGLVFAFLLDADVLLLDQALGTLALSADAGVGEETRMLALAFDVAGLLVQGDDYVIDEVGLPLLTDGGRERLRIMLEPRGGSWSGPRWREHLLTVALLVRFHLEPDVHFAETPTGVELRDAALPTVPDSGYVRQQLNDLLRIRLGRPAARAGAPVGTMSHMECLLRYRRVAGIMGRADRATRAELWSLYRLRCVGGPSARSDAPQADVHIVADRDQRLEEINAIVEKSRHEQGPAWLMTPDPEDALIVAKAIESRGLRVARVDADDAAPKTRGADVVVRVLGPSGPASSTALFGEGDLPGAIVFLQIPADGRREARWMELVGPIGRSIELHQFLNPDDPACRNGLCRWLVKGASRRSPRESRLARRLSELALRAAIRERGQHNRRARRDHRRIAGRVQKLLAFTGRSGN